MQSSTYVLSCDKLWKKYRNAILRSHVYSFQSMVSKYHIYFRTNDFSNNDFYTDDFRTLDLLSSDRFPNVPHRKITIFVMFTIFIIAYQVYLCAVLQTLKLKLRLTLIIISFQNKAKCWK